MQHLNLFGIIVVCFIINCVEVQGNYETSDFSVVRKSKYFVDKTLLIKDLISEDNHEEPLVKIITAPSRFGKSTIIDMLKRFLGIQVDDRGNQVSPETTDNYKLFCETNFNICKDKQFVNSHLGRYPVVHIDFRMLKGIIFNYDSALSTVRKILSATFAEHSYLDKVGGLWGRLDLINKDAFNAIIHSENILNSEAISRGFYLLSYVLYSHFGKKVIILIDEYDSYALKLLFDKSKDVDKFVDFFTNLNNGVIKEKNKYVKMMIVTGVLRTYEEEDNIQDYVFRGNHTLSKYFGFTKNDVDKFLTENVHDDKQKTEKSKDIESFYGGYTIQGQNESVFNMWSVLHYLKNNMVLKPYSADYQNIRSLSNIISEENTFTILVRLLKGKRYDLFIDEIYRTEDLVTLSKMKNKEADEHSYEPYCFFLLLYSLGYLTVDRNEADKIAFLNVVNIETKIDLTRELQKIYEGRFGYSSGVVNELNNAVDSFQLGTVKKETFQNFYNSLHKLLKHAFKHFDTNEDIQNIIFVNVFERFYRSKSDFDVVPRNENTVDDRGEVGVMVINSHKIVLVMDTKLFLSNQLKKKKLDDFAIEGHDKLISTVEKYIEEHILDRLGTIYMGLALNKDTGKLSLACTLSSNSDRDFKKTEIYNSNW